MQNDQVNPNDFFGGDTVSSGDPTSTETVFSLMRDELESLIIEANNDDKNAAFRLYQFYEFSVRDEKEADKWILSAAELGHKTAQYNLSKKFYQSQLYFDSLPWCNKAIQNGHSEAQELLRQIQKNLKL